MNTEQLVLSIICTVTWFAWIPAVLVEKEKNEDARGTSIFPVIPVFPLTLVNTSNNTVPNNKASEIQWDLVNSLI